jgi:hypothetical protein
VKLIILLFSLAFSVVLFTNCSSSSTPQPPPAAVDNTKEDLVIDPWNPPVGNAIEGATLFDGWTDLREVGGGINVNGGWTDSVGISWDGKSLFFGYSRFDFGLFNDSNGATWTATGPQRIGMTGDYFKMFSANLTQEKTWTQNFLPFNGDANTHEFAVQMNVQEDVAIYTAWVGNKGDLYFATKTNSVWSQPLPVSTIIGGSQINSICSDDNGFIVGDLATGIRLYFESDRADLIGSSCGANVHLYYSDYNPNTSTFSAVQAVPGVNGAAGTDKDYQPFFTPDKSKAFWTAVRSDDYAVYSADLSNGTYINSRPVVRPNFYPPFTGKLSLVGEANLAEFPQGWLMYMICGIAQSESGGKPQNVQLKICVARKLRQ